MSSARHARKCERMTVAEQASTQTAADDRGDLALVLVGGGARAAYQVGFLRSLVRRHPDIRLPIITGTSAGAINAAYLASRSGSVSEAVEGLVRLWSAQTVDQVFRVDSRSLFGHLLGWGISLASAVSGLYGVRRADRWRRDDWSRRRAPASEGMDILQCHRGDHPLVESLANTGDAAAPFFRSIAGPGYVASSKRKKMYCQGPGEQGR